RRMLATEVHRWLILDCNGLDESFHCKSAYSRGRALLSSFCRTALIATIEVRLALHLKAKRSQVSV
ncbi:hypothetical protein, partial [Slackia isoflavoniconvertens]|uniref:hypothetical protein n=1 Tax=Slackia isoflavoniconvertens TaxID=572010 RepID=UPI00307B05D0